MRMIATCVVDKFELPRLMAGHSFPFAKVTMHAASGIRFHKGNAWPTGRLPEHQAETAAFRFLLRSSSHFTHQLEQ
jgi:hypothetical protein